MNSKNLLLVGGGGHCKAIIDSLTCQTDYDKIAIIDLPQHIGTNIFDIPIIGSDDDLVSMYKNGYTYAFISLGTIGNVNLKMKLYNQIHQIGFIIPNIIDTSSIISKYVEFGNGVYVGKGSVINSNSKIGNGVIINTRAIIEHDCVINDFCHISSGAILCGNVCIEKQTHIGAGTVIKQGVHIGENVMVGIGSVVTKDIQSNKTAYGNPCKEKL